MNITNKDFCTIEAAVDLHKMDGLTDEEKIIVTSAKDVLTRLQEKREKDNKRIAGYIADKRKNNKNYARGTK